MPGVIEERLKGCIKWLPRKDELSPPEPDLHEDCCNHPVAILSSRATGGRVEFLIVTSFRGRDLEERHPGPRMAEMRSRYLPIKPSKAHPDNGVLLFMGTKSLPLDKNSYVKISQRYSIALASLRPYNNLSGNEFYLSTKSYQILARRIGFTEPLPEPPPRRTSTTVAIPPHIVVLHPRSEQLLAQDYRTNIENTSSSGRTYQSAPAVGSTPTQVWESIPAAHRRAIRTAIDEAYIVACWTSTPATREQAVFAAIERALSRQHITVAQQLALVAAIRPGMSAAIQEAVSAVPEQARPMTRPQPIPVARQQPTYSAPEPANQRSRLFGANSNVSVGYGTLPSYSRPTCRTRRSKRSLWFVLVLLGLLLVLAVGLLSYWVSYY